MHSFNVEGNSADESGNDSKGRVRGGFFKYNPPKFDLPMTNAANTYVSQKNEKPFEMADTIKVKTKVDEVEKISMQEKIELEVLERLKEAQEKSYQEGFTLGREDGRAEAFAEKSLEFQTAFEKFEELLSNMQNIKTEMVKMNEGHFVQFALHLASRLTYSESTARPSVLIELIQQLIELERQDEKIVIRLNPDQLSLIESVKKELRVQKTTVDTSVNITLEPDHEISTGGCIIQTNYSEIDARIEERIKVLWELMGDTIYKTKDVISA